jgi:hypothetical protein
MNVRTVMSALFVLCVLAPSVAGAQAAGGRISVAPAVVTVNAQGPSTAVLTFSGMGRNAPDTGVRHFVPAEALWCGRVVASAAAGGSRCDAASVYGQAPAGGAFAVSVTGVFMDIMSVPAPVARRAYEAARSGQPARFFYVRRFTSSAPAPAIDQYVVVTLLLGGSGVGVPFTLTDVWLHLARETPVLFVQRGDRPPPLYADIAYTGTGRLRGRWEVVYPGEDPPSSQDLLTEGSLPPAQRGLQRRFREVERFNVLLLPTGRSTLPGPDPSKLPTSIDGSYVILLRIEASDGAAAGFPMPTFRYIVGAAETRSAPLENLRSVQLRLPSADALVSPDSALTLSWFDVEGAARNRVEIERIADGVNVLSAIVTQGVGRYDVPPFVLAQVPSGKLRWRVIALDAQGSEAGRSVWRTVKTHQVPKPAG